MLNPVCDKHPKHELGGGGRLAQTGDMSDGLP